MEPLKKNLKKLLTQIPDITVKGGDNPLISGLCNHSKRAAPGNLFFAKQGTKTKGNDFIQEAIAAGAVAVVTDLFDPFLEGVVQVICKDVPSLEAIIAARFYDNPSQKILAIGVTGTNGKTTSTYLIKHLLQGFGCDIGLIGTMECIVKDTVFPSSLTTPDILSTQKLFYDMWLAGCQGGVMEVSSHGLDQNRVGEIDFDVGLFTNLTQDHLDYHKTMEEYAKAKAKLFVSLRPKVSENPLKKRGAVINIDSPWATTMIQGIQVPVISYGLSQEADIRAQEIRLTPKGTYCKLAYLGETIPFYTPLIGKFNIYNWLGAIGVAVVLGFPFSLVVERASLFKGVAGRLEGVENSCGKNIFVDYAHTEDALKNVLESLKEVVEGRLLCVFGCGGDRDRSKRPKMGKVVEDFADEVFVTSDNPRGEDPEKIIDEILSGMQNKSRVVVEIDRHIAIAKAVESLKEKDVLLIAGKGHETYQIFGHKTIHFDDRIVAKQYC